MVNRVTSPACSSISKDPGPFRCIWLSSCWSWPRQRSTSRSVRPAGPALGAQGFGPHQRQHFRTPSDTLRSWVQSSGRGASVARDFVDHGLQSIPNFFLATEDPADRYSLGLCSGGQGLAFECRRRRQIVFIKLVEKIRQFDYNPPVLRGWLRTVTYYEFVNWWRRQPATGEGAITGEGDLLNCSRTRARPAFCLNWKRSGPETSSGVLQWALEKVRKEFDEATFEAFRSRRSKARPWPPLQRPREYRSAGLPSQERNLGSTAGRVNEITGD